MKPDPIYKLGVLISWWLNKHMNTNTSGNVLFIILIAIALFSALSYVVSNMLRGGSGTEISEQRAEVFAGEILNYARSIRQGVHTVLINGCDVLDVSFTTSSLSGYDHTPAADNSCKVFHTDGGGISYIAPLDDWLDDVSGPPALQGQWYFPADTCIPDIGTSTTGCESDSTDNEDLILILPYIKAQICRELNNMISGSETILSGTDDEWPDGDTKFSGNMSDDTVLNQDGRMSGCFSGDGGTDTPASNTYHFFQVLKPR